MFSGDHTWQHHQDWTPCFLEALRNQCIKGHFAVPDLPERQLSLDDYGVETSIMQGAGSRIFEVQRRIVDSGCSVRNFADDDSGEDWREEIVVENKVQDIMVCNNADVARLKVEFVGAA